MSPYLVHSSRERARFRHPAFADAGTKALAMETLKDEKGIAGIKPGHSSILIFIEPEANIEEICRKLEDKIPVLQEMPAKKPEVKAEPIRKTSNVPCQIITRKRLLKTFFATGVATVSFALLGMHHVHAWAGGLFTILGINHVWVRRKGL